MPKPSRSKNDVVMVYGRSEDGKSYGVLRQRGDEVHAGTLRPLEQGKPIQGEVIRLKPRDDSRALYDVEVQLEMGTGSGRPAQVASERYRKGWDTIWSKRRAAPELN
jgi:hypothetical protein